MRILSWHCIGGGRLKIGETQDYKKPGGSGYMLPPLEKSSKLHALRLLLRHSWTKAYYYLDGNIFAAQVHTMLDSLGH